MALVAIGALLRLRYLGQPMRYDESVTYLNFVAGSWNAAVSSYTYPNNHVLHTLLVKVCVTLFGDEPWVIRLPAFVAGVGMIPMTFVVGRRLFGSPTGYIGASLVAASGTLTLYSTNARGYSIVCLVTLVLIAVLLRLRDESSVKLFATAAIVTALGLWTVPTMLFPAGGLALWFTLSARLGDTKGRRADIQRLWVAAAVTIALTALLYSPIVAGSGLAALTNNAFVRSSPWRVFFAEIPSSLRQTLSGWATGFPLLISAAFAACAVIGLASERRASGIRVSIVGSLYIWCSLTLLFTHRAPFPRVWLFLVAPLAILAAQGVTQLLADIPNVGDRIARHAATAGIILATALGGVVVLSNDVATSRDTGTLFDAEQIATSFSSRLRPGDRVIAPLPSNAPLAYYFARQNIDTTYLSSVPTDSSRVFLIVNTGEGFTLNTPLGDPLARRFRSAQLIERFPFAELYRLY